MTSLLPLLLLRVEDLDALQMHVLLRAKEVGPAGRPLPPERHSLYLADVARRVLRHKEPRRPSSHHVEGRTARDKQRPLLTSSLRDNTMKNRRMLTR